MLGFTQPNLAKAYLLNMETQEYVEDIDFQKYWLIIKRHWLAGGILWIFVLMVSVFFALTTEKTYEASGKLRFKKQDATSALVTEAGEKIGKIETLSSKDTPLDTEAEVLRSEPIINQTIQALNLKDKKGNSLTYEEFLKNIEVKTIRGTDILLISCKDRQPQTTKLVVDKVMELYIKNNILVNRAEAASAREFINGQLPKNKEVLLKAEAALRTFKEKNNIIDLDTEAKMLVSQIGSLDNQIDQTKADIQKVTGQILEMQQKMGITSQQALMQNVLSNSSGVQQALSKLQEIENQLAAERSRFQEDSPIIANLKSKKADMETLLNQRLKEVVGQQQKIPSRLLKTQIQVGNLASPLIPILVGYEAEQKGLVKRLLSLEQIQKEQRERANIIPKLQQVQVDLERQQKSAQLTYENLIKSLEQLGIIENQNVGNAQIVSPALISKYPVNKSAKVVVGAGVVVGGMLYLITAFVFELMDRSLKSSKEVRHILSYTLLGMIPSVKRKRKNMFSSVKVEQIAPEYQVRDRSNSIISETYKMLQANLRFISPDQDLKVIVVTSSVPKEGKSTVAANLAVAISQLENRVLLIDADLQHPRQHHIWELTNETGLSEVIVNRTELTKTIKQVMPNLDVLPSGVIPPNSLALLNSQRMNSLINHFRENYDFVIIDTPPLLLVADAITVSKMTDGILLVARPGVIDKASATASRDLLTQSRQKVLGLVLNGIIMENEPDSYFHHVRAYSEVTHAKKFPLNLKLKR